MRLSKRGTTNWATSAKVNVVDQHPMSKDEFQQACTILEIDDAVTAAELFGLSWRTCQRYHYGDLPVPGPLARLLRVAVNVSLDLAALRKLSTAIAPKTTRRPPRT